MHGEVKQMEALKEKLIYERKMAEGAVYMPGNCSTLGCCHRRFSEGKPVEISREGETHDECLWKRPPPPSVSIFKHSVGGPSPACLRGEAEHPIHPCRVCVRGHRCTARPPPWAPHPP